MITLGAKIRKLRNQKGVSQAMAAEGIGIAKSTLASYELDKREPDIENINKIAKYFRIDPGELVKKDYFPNYRALDLKKLFDHEDITVEGRRLTEREKYTIYKVIKALIFKE